MDKYNLQEKKGDPKVPMVYAKELEPFIDEFVKLNQELKEKQQAVDEKKAQIETLLNTETSEGTKGLKDLISEFKSQMKPADASQQVRNIIETSHSIIELTRTASKYNSAVKFSDFEKFCNILYGVNDGQLKYQTVTGDSNAVDMQKVIATYKKEHPKSHLSEWLSAVFEALDKIYSEAKAKVVTTQGVISTQTKQESISYINEVSISKLLNAFKKFIKQLINKVNTYWPYKQNAALELNKIKSNIIAATDESTLVHTAQNIIKKNSNSI